MIKLIFRLSVIVIFCLVLAVGLAFWKGGEPFRVMGDGTVRIGQAISEFGDFVDELIMGSKKIKKSYKELQEVIGIDDEDRKKHDK